MQSLDRVVQLQLPRISIGQILDSLEVLIEQWEATAAYMRDGEIGEWETRECSDAEEADEIAERYAEISAAIRKQLAAIDADGE